MTIERKLAVALPPGKGHRGMIIRATETKVDFGSGPENTVQVTLQPAFQDKDGTEALPVTFNVAPNLTGKPGAGLSALARLYDNLGLGWESDVSDMEGLEVTFDASLNDNGFINVDKRSVRKVVKIVRK